VERVLLMIGLRGCCREFAEVHRAMSSVCSGSVLSRLRCSVSVVVGVGGAGTEVRKAGLVVGCVFAQVERRHPPRWFRRRHTPALQV
jgi:hypothetical protein